MNLIIETERLIIEPFTEEYLEDYYREFTDKITKYQYPDSFKDIENAREVVSEFVADMEQGEMLELVILTKDEEFLGSIEVFGLKETEPEIGLWLKEATQGKGYGYEALKGVLDYLNSTEKYKYYIYEADVRNEKSIRLVEKFEFEKGGCEELTTESGKLLKLQAYYIHC